MSEYRKIVGACGWFLEREELPLIAHRIATHSAERIKELQAKVEKLETALAVCDVPVKRLTAKVEELQKWKDYVMENNEFYHSQEVSDADT